MGTREARRLQLLVLRYREQVATLSVARSAWKKANTRNNLKLYLGAVLSLEQFEKEIMAGNYGRFM